MQEIDIYTGLGIIPAYAGSTGPDGRRRARTADHPRIRGEHDKNLLAATGGEGSSPHTRGAPGPVGVEPAGAGIIPAYAGSTPTRAHETRRLGDHPRIRGEHEASPSPKKSSPGSSPHTRGAHRRPERQWAWQRIIPAYAGSTSLVMRSCCLGRDHPRIRGEHSYSVSAERGRHGSSPHTRGALPDVHGRHRRTRIIPAYAGSTQFLVCGLSK